MPTLMSFTFPPHQEHPESLGRLEVFARYGPTDEEGRLRGGILGSHTNTDVEIRNMINFNTREALFSILKRPRNQTEVLVDAIVPQALEENITRCEVRKLLSSVPKDVNGRMTFDVLQETVLANQQQRLQAILKDHAPGKKEKGSKIQYQCKQADARLAITHRKKMNVPQENYAQEKRLHAYSTALATMEDCHGKARQVNLNVVLCRQRGDVSDRWDRCCSVRRTGRSGYVKARNHPRTCAALDDGLADRHPGVSSLAATMS